jgi:hypothetical protein
MGCVVRRLVSSDKYGDDHVPFLNEIVLKQNGQVLPLIRNGGFHDASIVDRLLIGSPTDLYQIFQRVF